MSYSNVAMIEMITEEKRYKPLIIEGVIIQHVMQTSIWRQRLAAWLRQMANSLEHYPTLNLETA